MKSMFSDANASDLIALLRKANEGGTAAYKTLHYQEAAGFWRTAIRYYKDIEARRTSERVPLSLLNEALELWQYTVLMYLKTATMLSYSPEIVRLRRRLYIILLLSVDSGSPQYERITSIYKGRASNIEDDQRYPNLIAV